MLKEYCWYGAMYALHKIANKYIRGLVGVEGSIFGFKTNSRVPRPCH